MTHNVTHEHFLSQGLTENVEKDNYDRRLQLQGLFEPFFEFMDVKDRRLQFKGPFRRSIREDIKKAKVELCLEGICRWDSEGLPGVAWIWWNFKNSQKFPDRDSSPKTLALDLLLKLELW